MAEKPKPEQAEPYSQTYAPLVNAAVAYWAGYIPKDAQELFISALTREINAYLDRPVDPSLANNPHWLPAVEFPFGIGVHGSDSDMRLRKALSEAGVEGVLFPSNTHTVIDVENYDVYLKNT